MTDVFNVRKCPLCGGTEFIYNRDTGEVVCKNCGYVVKTVNIDPGPEWSNYPDKRQDNARAGPPLTPLIIDRGITTKFKRIWDGDEMNMSWERVNDIERIRRWTHRSFDNRDRNLRNALNILQLYSGKVNASGHVLERAAEIYRMILEKDLVRGRTIRLLVAVSLYIALREFQIAYPVKSIVGKFNVDAKLFNKYYNFLLRKLNIKVPNANPSLYVRRIVSKTGLPQDTVAYAEKIINIAREKRITAGKNPVVIASASVYYAALLNDYKVTQQKIAEASGITIVTVRNKCRWLMNSLGFKDLVELRRIIEVY